jgi:hypothetical protein
VDVYSYTPTRTGTITIELRSTDFDALVGIESQDGTELARDDDGGGERNSRLVFTVNAGTTYRIRVGAFGAIQRGGAYILSVLSGAMPAGTYLDNPTTSIKGRPLASGTFNFVLQLTDSGGLPFATTTANFQWTVGVTRRYTQNLEASLFYTHSEVRDVQSLTSSTTVSRRVPR